MRLFNIRRMDSVPFFLKLLKLLPSLDMTSDGNAFTE